MTKKENQNIEVSSSQHEEATKRCSDVTNYTHECSQSQDLKRLQDEFEHQEGQSGCQKIQSMVEKLLQKKGQECTIGSVLQKKAVNWLISLCWTRGYKDEVLWYSIGYFYAYVHLQSLEKQRLSVLLMTMVNLALKLIEPQKAMKISEMKKLLNNVFPSEETFSQTEGKILQQFGFDLYFQTNLQELIEKVDDEAKRQKMLLLCEIMFLANCKPLVNRQSMKQIEKLIDRPETDSWVKDEIRRLLFEDSKYVRIIRMKYSSKIDVDRLIQELTK